MLSTAVQSLFPAPFRLIHNPDRISHRRSARRQRPSHKRRSRRHCRSHQAGIPKSGAAYPCRARRCLDSVSLSHIGGPASPRAREAHRPLATSLPSHVSPLRELASVQKEIRPEPPVFHRYSILSQICPGVQWTPATAEKQGYASWQTPALSGFIKRQILLRRSRTMPPTVRRSPPTAHHAPETPSFQRARPAQGCR